MFSGHLKQHAVSNWHFRIRITFSYNEVDVVTNADITNDDVTNDDVTKHASRIAKCSRVITFKMEFPLSKRYITNKLSIQ